MAQTASRLELRIDIICAVLTNPIDRHSVATEFRAADGDASVALANLTEKLSPPAHKKLSLAHSLADWTGDNLALVSHFVEQDNISDLRDVALHYSAERLAAVVDPHDIPASVTGATVEEKTSNFAASLSNKLFAAETTAVLQRMVQNSEIPISDPSLRTGVVDFLEKQPDFNIRTTSVYTALKQPDALSHVAESLQPAVISTLKSLQRVQAMSHVSEAVPALIKRDHVVRLHEPARRSPPLIAAPSQPM